MFLIVVIATVIVAGWWVILYVYNYGSDFLENFLRGTCSRESHGGI